MLILFLCSMAGAAIHISMDDGSDAVDTGSARFPLSSFSASAKDIYDDPTGYSDIYVSSGGHVTINSYQFKSPVGMTRYIMVESITSGYGLSVTDRYVDGTITGSGDLTVVITKQGSTSSCTITIHAVGQFECHLYFDMDGGSGGPSTVTESNSTGYMMNLYVPSTTPTKTHYTFSHWIRTDSSNARYYPGDLVQLNAGDSAYFQAVWVGDAITVRIYLGGYESFYCYKDGNTYTSTATISMNYGDSLDVDWSTSYKEGSGSGYTYYRTESSCRGMATSLYGTDLGDYVYVDATKYYPAYRSDSQTVYTYSYTIKYSANGGSGAPSDTTTTSSSSSTSIKLSTVQPTRTGHTFLGWSDSSTATSASYSPGASYSFGYGTTQLYAVWQASAVSVSGTPDQYGIVGSAWSFSPTVTPSGCSVTISGASWLTANGTTVAGTPTAPGTYDITLTFSKSGHTSAVRTFQVTVYSALSFESSPTGGAIIYAI